MTQPTQSTQPSGTEHNLTQFTPGVDVTTTATLTSVVGQNLTATKVIVAVHGVGDQHSFATIQSVVNQFCNYYQQPAGIPLGNFHTGNTPFAIPLPYPRDPFERFAFAEVYWAKVPRELVTEAHTVEETKAWARTIIERLRIRWRANGASEHWRESDFRLTTEVVGEIIETIAVVDRICFLAAKAGLFTFDLKRLLDDYLGDVQVVAEFGKQRRKILDAFAQVMEAVHKACPRADIYIISHSEGTVVSLLGLLEAFREQKTPQWTEHVRGFMTLGSPLDKHLILWPEIFRGPSPARTKKDGIEWRNYYDNGDPIGFELDGTRAWLAENGWTNVFNFPADHDHGFTRYPFPGQAHGEYWKDPEVFGHFITNVLKESPKPPLQPFTAPPGTIRFNQMVSYVLPYTIVFALMFIAAYVLFKAVTGAIDPTGKPGFREIVGGASGLAALLAGVTIVARIPRLTRSPFWRRTALAIAGLSALIYVFSLKPEAPMQLFGMTITDGAVTLALAILATVVVYVLSALRPDWGLKPLLAVGTAAVIWRVGVHVAPRTADSPLWPVVIATVAFLYLWWLAALVFDLVFVWHLYIRHSKLLLRMNGMCAPRSRASA